MTDLTEWSSNANDVVRIRVKHNKPEATSHVVAFQPAFTYPIFGEEETVFGYKGLKIKLDFVADTLEPTLNVTWKDKFQEVGETKADDVQEVMKSHMPDTPEDAPMSLGEAWEPPGELLHQYEVDGRTFGIWSTNLSNPVAKQILKNMQILVLFFIEGGSMIELEDVDWTIERWTLFLIYAIDPLPLKPQQSSYTLAGYSTTYRLFFLDTASPLYAPITASPETSPLDIPTDDDSRLISRLPCRQRISQFLILPPYQSSGHGSILYSTILNHFLAAPTVTEITVEDPNESFDDLRDINDLNRLRSTNPTFASLTLDTKAKLPTSRSAPFDPALLLPPILVATLHTETKLAPRQFARLVEMQLLTNIPSRHRHIARITRKDKSSDDNDRAYYFWRLYVKQRLYRHNLDQLAQLDLEERVEKLEETCSAVERDYERLMEVAEMRARKVGSGDAVAGAEDMSGVEKEEERDMPVKGKKRKVVLEDDEEDEEGDGAVANGSSKRANGAGGVDPPVKAPATNGKSSVKKKVRLEVVDLASDD